MSSDVERESPVIESIDQLVALPASGEKPRDRFAIGTEQEKLGFFTKDLSPLDYEHGIRPMLRGLMQYGWQPDPDADRPIALKRNGASVSLEPGGQLELSGAPLKSLHDSELEIRTHLQEVLAVAAPLGIAFTTLGFRPLEATGAMPWMPKERYRQMRAYLPQKGRAALEMMLLSATVQANFDYASEADMAHKMRCAMGVSPLVAALFANSPYIEREFRGFRTRRYAMWRDVDNDRCGLLPFVFEKDFGYRDYVEWALDVPMFFVRRGGAYHTADHVSFRTFMRDGFQGSRATLADFENHLASLFPEVRLKTFLEVRSADAGTPEMAVALAALWKGILYDDAALREATALTQHLAFVERLHMQIAVAERALAAHGPRWHAGELAQDLVRIAHAGLSRQAADEARYLAPLERIVGSRRTHADDLLERFGAGPLDDATARRLLEATTYR